VGGSKKSVDSVDLATVEAPLEPVVEVRNRFSRRIQVLAPPPEEGKGAKQQFKDECDINLIMLKFQRTGMITHVNRHEPSYGDVPSQSYHEAMEIVRQANEMFAEVPASIRKKFGNDPAAFMEFVSEEKNVEELRKLGLAKPKVDRPRDPIEVLGDRIEAVMRPKKTNPEDSSGTVAS